MDFSTILKELRTEKGLPQSSLAELLGITQDSISLWENGKRIPDTQYLVKLADIFSVATDYLLGRSDDFGGIAVSPAVPALSEEERLALFGQMTHPQKIRVIAYSEGLLSTSSERQSQKTQA